MTIYHFPLTSVGAEAAAVVEPYEFTDWFIVIIAPLFSLALIMGFILLSAVLEDGFLPLLPEYVVLLYVISSVYHALYDISWSFLEEFVQKKYLKGAKLYKRVESVSTGARIVYNIIYYLMSGFGILFLAVLPSILGRSASYKYWQALYTGLLFGFTTHGIAGLKLGNNVPNWPFVLIAFTAMGGALTVCAATVSTVATVHPFINATQS